MKLSEQTRTKRQIRNKRTRKIDHALYLELNFKMMVCKQINRSNSSINPINSLLVYFSLKYNLPINAPIPITTTCDRLCNIYVVNLFFSLFEYLMRQTPNKVNYQ